jgi:hypothetical protein
MRSEGIAEPRFSQDVANSKVNSGTEASPVSAATDQPAAATKRESARAILPVAPVPLVSGDTLVVITAMASAHGENASTEDDQSAESPVFAARGAIAENPSLGTLPFGRLVSAIARGFDPTSLLTEAPRASSPDGTAAEDAEINAPDPSSLPPQSVSTRGPVLTVAAAVVSNLTPEELARLQTLYA